MKTHPLIRKFTELGYHPEDSEEQKVEKSTLTVLSIPFATAGLIWGLLYFLNELYIPGLIPFSYGILSIISFIIFSITKRYKLFRNSQLFLILILPFLLQLSLGGFIQSSAVILWGLIAPVGALVFFKTKQTIAWFIAYLILVLTAYFLNDLISKYFSWNLDEQFINIVFVLNIMAVSILIYVVQYYYVGKQTELKEAIEEKSKSLAEQTERLKEMDALKSRFFANISHEFRTPLTLILGLLNKQLANADLPPDQHDTDTMLRNANRLLQLINQLLDLSKLESDEVKLHISLNDIHLVCKKTILLYESFGFERNIKISFNGKHLDQMNHRHKIEAYFDLEKMQKIFSNLISNAIKFTPAEGEIDIELYKKENEVHFIISNSGPGIPASNLPHIFNRFYQVDGDSTREYEGTGIGLSLVKELVELHHGNITVKSNPERTTFTMIFPCNEDAFDTIEESKNEPKLAPSISTNYIPQLKTKMDEDDHIELAIDRFEILVVEDNADIRHYIHNMLHDNYSINLAADGKEGLEKALATIPDLIISDIMMPKMNGYDLCKQIKTNSSTNHIPVILLTAKASHENKLEGLETGADDYLTKPFDENELKIRIKNLIKIRERLQKKYQKESVLGPKEVEITSVQQKFLEKMKEVIEKNIDNHSFSVDDLGVAVGMSRSQIHRKLKAITDQSATTFIRNYRLFRSLILLKKDAGNITEIAYQVGFSSQTYFSKCFQELFNVSPSDYKTSKHR
jgi:signal transduction histidine kinase/DNA-binding response OmpR family regulator